MVRAALYQFSCGDFAAAAQLADSCLEDAEVLGCVEARVRALSSRSALPFEVVAGTGDKRIVEPIRKRINELWWHTCREDVIEPMLRDTVLLKTAVGRIHWELTGTEWVPVLVHLSPHGLQHEESSGRWYYTGRDGKRQLITPGDGRWFLHLPSGRRSYMTGALRAIAEPWLSRRYASRDANRWCERHGMAVLAVKEPLSAHDEVEGTPNGTKVYRQVQQGMTSGAIIRLPQGATKDEPGWEAEFLELTGTSFDGFERVMARSATDIQTALLGRARDGQAKGGDGELASETHRNEHLVSDSEPLITSLREQVWKPFVAYNWNPRDLEVTSWGRWNVRRLTDYRQRAELLGVVADSIAKLRALGLDDHEALEEFGLTAGAVPPVAQPMGAANAA